MKLISWMTQVYRISSVVHLMEVSVGVDTETFVLYIATTTNHLQTSFYFTADFFYLFTIGETSIDCTIKTS